MEVVNEQILIDLKKWCLQQVPDAVRDIIDFERPQPYHIRINTILHLIINTEFADFWNQYRIDIKSPLSDNPLVSFAMISTLL